MTFEEVEKNIEGSILKTQYLEAFLLQSAYIEGVIKEYACFKSWQAICNNKELNEHEEKIAWLILNDIKKYSFYKLIDYLFEAGYLQKEDKKILHSYREKRNEIAHSLVKKVSEKDFNKELQTACEQGQAIMKNKNLVQMSKLIRGSDSEKQRPS